MTKKYIIGEKLRDFYKLTHGDGNFEYINKRKLDLLKKDESVKLAKFVEAEVEEVKPSKEVKEVKEVKQGDDLNSISHKDLIELAKRLGLDSANNSTSKKQLIEYIAKKQ